MVVMDNIEAINQISSRLDEQNKLLSKQDKKLSDIQTALAQISVQDEQIRQIRKEQSAMWDKIDGLTANDGIISQMQQKQASCPRDQIKSLWYIVVPMGLTQIGVAIAIIRVAMNVAS